LTTTLSIIVAALYGTNAPVLHIEALVQYIFYSSIYYCLFNNKAIRKAIVLSIILVSVFAIANALFFQPFLKVYPTYVNLPTLAALTILSLLLFRQMLLYPLKTPLLKQGVFWYNTAILFYSTTLFLTIGFSNIYRKDLFFAYIYYLWYVILYIFALLTALALLTDSKENNKPYAI